MSSGPDPHWLAFSRDMLVWVLPMNRSTLCEERLFRVRLHCSSSPPSMFVFDILTALFMG